MHKLQSLVLSFALLAAAPSVGETWTVTVPDGETQSLQTAIEALIAEKGHGFAGGDIIEKYGGGRLIGTNTWKTANIGLRVKEGVYEARLLGDLFAGEFVTVSDGASLLINNKMTNGKSISNNKTFFLNGAGCQDAAVNGLTGAIVFGGSVNYEVLNKCTFTLQSDAAIALGVANQFGMFTYGIINPDNHKLTLLGGGHTLSSNGSISNLYQLRFRFGYGFSNATEIVVNGGALVAHNTTYWARPNKAQRCTVTNGGVFGPDGQSFADCFKLVAFDPGTFVAPANAASITMPEIEGCPFFSGNVTPTINKAWTVRADELPNGVVMGARKALTFSSGATLAVKDVELLDSGASYTIATSLVSIAGAPAMSAGTDMPRYWNTVNTDSKTLSLVYEPPAGVVNVRNWGVLPGAANAAANDAAFAAGLAALSGSGNTVFFPQGDYYFSAPLAVSNASGLTLLGDNGFSVVNVTDASAQSVLSVSGGTDVTVTGLRFAGGAGVAVAASGTDGLTVTNNVYTNIVGTVSGVDGTYPVSAADCPNVYVKYNRVLGGAAYTKFAYVSGTTTQRDGSDPDSGELEFFVDNGLTENFTAVMARSGLAEYPADTKLVKTGLGRFYGTNSTAIRERISQIVVREGTYVGSHRDAWARAPSNPDSEICVKVEDGATALLEIYRDQQCANGISFELGGKGTATSGGYSLAFRGSSWQMTYYCRFFLRNDTSFGHLSDNSIGIFSQSQTYQNGHTLVLRGYYGTASNFRFRENHVFHSPGPIVVSNAMLSASYATGKGWYCPDGKPPLLKFGRNSKFVPDTQAFLNVFDLYEFDAGIPFTCNTNCSFTIARLKGAPALGGTVALTVTDEFIARASDLLDGGHMTATRNISFAEDCVANVEDAASLPYTNAGYVMATSTTAINGRPKKSSALLEAGWTTTVSSDGKTLRLIPVGGTTIFIR